MGWLKEARRNNALAAARDRMSVGMHPIDAAMDLQWFSLARAKREFSNGRCIDGWLVSTSTRFAFMSARSLLRDSKTWSSEEVLFSCEVLDNVCFVPPDRPGWMDLVPPVGLKNIRVSLPAAERLLIGLQDMNGSLVFHVYDDVTQFLFGLDLALSGPATLGAGDA